MLFSLLDIPMHVANNSAGEFPSLHSLFSMYSLRCFQMAIPTNMSAYIIEHLICLFLIICDAEHLFMCQLQSVGLLWKNIHYDLWPIIFLGCMYFWYRVAQALYLRFGDKFLVCVSDWKHFFLLWMISFYFLWSFPCYANAFKVSSVQFLIYGLLLIILNGSSTKNLLQIMSNRVLFIFFQNFHSTRSYI